MKKILFITGLFLIATPGYSQRYIKPYAGLNLCSRQLTSEYTKRKDSLDQADKMKIFPSGGIQFLFEKTAGRELYFGFSYSEMGFVRERLNYQFFDTVHPDLGRIVELSQGAQKNGYFTYHFKYFEIPLGMNWQVTPRQAMHIYTGWINVGLNPQFLLKQNMTIFLQGFSMDGKHRFNFANTGYEAAKFNMTVQAGGRVDIALNRSNSITVDAQIKCHLITTAENASEKFRIWNGFLGVGLRHEIRE